MNLTRPTDAAPLAVFRIFFGAVMVFGMLRFWWYGWIDKLYVQPEFFFKYRGFAWVQPLGEWTWVLFALCGVAAFCVLLGWRYRLAIVMFFLSFTYIELMDKTNYLNHYYFVSCVAFLLCFLPAHATFSLDARRKKLSPFVPRYAVYAVRFMLTIVWFYAGLAKLNSDWLLHAQPLKIWLTAKYDVPVLGDFLQWSEFHYLFSWAGAAYDLTIPFLLWNARTRLVGFALVVVFHVLTWLLFPIGIFPWVMIGSSLVFFNGKQIRSANFSSLKRTNDGELKFALRSPLNFVQRVVIPGILVVFFAVQLLVPFRHLQYPGELFWTEEGFRFSWRVMLMEKAGYITFRVVDPATGRRFYVQNDEFLNPLQQKHLATQPDFILEYVRFLEKHYQAEGIADPEIYAESYVALNGRSSQPYVRSDVDLTTVRYSDLRETYLEPFPDTIHGF